jgi:uncharacterized protein YkwD
MLKHFSRVRVRLLLSLTVLSALFVFGIQPSSAASAPTLTVSPTSGQPGAVLRLDGAGFPAWQYEYARWDGSRTGMPYAHAGSTGRFTLSVTIPTSATPGVHTLSVTSGGVTRAKVAVTVVSKTVASTTPTTQPTTSPVPTSTPVTTTQTPTFESQVITLVNKERAANGLAPLVQNAALSRAASSYASVMASTDCMAHTCGPVPNFADRDVQAGYTPWTTLAENVAAGQQTPDAVVAAWMNSPGHRANILNAAFRDIGVGVAKGGSYGIYWAQEFGAQ